MDVKVDTKTLKAQRDTGKWTDLDSLLALVKGANKQLEEATKSQSNWDTLIKTREFGEKNIAEAMGGITPYCFLFRAIGDNCKG